MVERFWNLNLFALSVLREEGVGLLELAEDLRLLQRCNALRSRSRYLLVRGTGSRS